jgi:hypothetical protein
VTLDRRSIEKRDFPLARKGYEPRAVEAHLAEIADALESIQAESRAASAADQVREIVGAAERSAAKIRRDAADHVATVAQAADGMLQRIEAMDADVNALIASVREGVKRLKAEMATLETEVAAPAPHGVASRSADSKAATSTAAASKEAPSGETPSRKTTSKGSAPKETAPKEAGPKGSGSDDAAAVAAPSNGAAAEDEEAARLVALNMALSGVSREDAKKDLGEQFDVPDLDGLLDDVYARAGGS